MPTNNEFYPGLLGFGRRGFSTARQVARRPCGFGLSRLRPIHYRITATLLDSRVLSVLANGFTVPQPVVDFGPEHAGRFHAEKTDPKSGIPIYSADCTIDQNLLRETRSVDRPDDCFFRRFLHLRRRSERCGHATTAICRFARAQAKGAQSWLSRLWTAAIFGGIANGPASTA